MSMTLLTGSRASTLKGFFTNIIASNQVSIQISNLAEELKNQCISPYAKTLVDMRLFQGAKPFKTKWAIVKDQALMQSPAQKHVKRSYKNDNGLFLIYNVLLTMPEKLGVLEAYVKRYMPDNLAKESMNYTQLNIIRLIESGEFMVQYARRFLYWTIYLEGQELGKGLPQNPPFQPAVVKWLDNNFEPFYKFLTIWSYSTSEFNDRLSGIPPIVVPSDVKEEAEVNSVYNEKVDPMRMNFIPTVLNPVYYIRSMLLEYRHWRVESARAEAEALEMDIESYASAIEGEITPQQEKVLESMREAVAKQNAKWRKLEEEFNKTYDLG